MKQKTKMHAPKNSLLDPHCPLLFTTFPLNGLEHRNFTGFLQDSKLLFFWNRGASSFPLILSRNTPGTGFKPGWWSLRLAMLTERATRSFPGLWTHTIFFVELYQNSVKSLHFLQALVQVPRHIYPSISRTWNYWHDKKNIYVCKEWSHTRLWEEQVLRVKTDDTMHSGCCCIVSYNCPWTFGRSA
jgi:hypothetical protein